MTDPRSLIFSRIAERTVRAAVVTDQSGVIAHIEPAAALAEELGLTVEYAVAEGKPVSAGEEVLRVSGSPLAVAHADERLVGMMAKPSGIATAAQAFVDHAAGELRIVSGAWKKLPLSQKDMIRTAITIGGAEPRIAQWPFVYLDKTFVQMLGGVGASLAAVAEHQALAQHRRVIQVTTAAGICAVADIVVTHPQRYAGFVAQERFRLPEILQNRFGRHYSQGDTKHVSADAVVTGKAGRQRQIRREG